MPVATHFAIGKGFGFQDTNQKRTTVTENLGRVFLRFQFGDISCMQKSTGTLLRDSAQKCQELVYNCSVRTNIDINETLMRKAKKLTRLKTKRQIVDKALELLVRSESRKGILRYYGSGIWQGDAKAMRRSRA